MQHCYIPFFMLLIPNGLLVLAKHKADGFRKFPKKFLPPRQGRFGSFFRWLPLLSELVMTIPVLEISGHRIPYGQRVVERAVLGGLHHEYRLEEVAS
jgi:hypothetical protein